VPHGLQDATTDSDVIPRWWDKEPEANIGIRTGAVSDLVVLDIDPARGGDDAFASLEQKHGTLPLTVESVTGGGGRHLLFQHPGEGVYVPCGADVLGRGLDVKGDGGYIVAPPSLHQTGRRYAWQPSRGPDDLKPAPLPRWLHEKLTSRTPAGGQTAVSATEEPIPEGRRNVTLTSLAGSMRRPGMSEEAILAALRVENATRCQPPLPDAEVQQIAASVGRYPPADGVEEDGDLTAALHRAFNAFRSAPHCSSSSFSSSPAPPSPDTEPWPTLDPAARYGLAGRIVETIEPNSEADPVAVLLHVLAAFGNVIGHGPHFRVERTRHPLRLNVGLVGRTSRARKGTAWSTPRDLFTSVDPAWGKNCVTSGLSSGEGLIYAVRDSVMQGTKIVDQGVTDKRLLVVEEEFAQALKVMAREGNILSPTIRQAWDDGDLHPLTKTSPIRATGAHISIIGHITQEELLRHLHETELANGFANRFIWQLVRRSKLIPNPTGTPPDKLQPLVAQLTNAVTFAATVGEMVRDDETEELWRDVYPRLSADHTGLLGAVLARAEAQAMRIACLYAILDLSSRVCRVHLEAALALWRRAEASARAIFGDRLGNPVADRILDALRASGELDETAIHDLFGRNKAKAEITPALDLLRRLGRASGERRQTGGRPRIVWRPTS
jgi:hypothetical protein